MHNTKEYKQRDAITNNTSTKTIYLKILCTCAITFGAYPKRAATTRIRV